MRDPASFRDPAGYVCHVGEQVYRVVSAEGDEDYRRVRTSGVIAAAAAAGRLVATRELDSVPPQVLAIVDAAPAAVLEHERLPLISYPYEWCFGQLRDAALLHLDLHIDALRRHDITLSDASAYNIQFHGCRPVFIDVLSFQPYRDGDYWRAHQQFCEHFLYPLLLTAWFNVPFNSWLRGSLAGVRAIDFARLVPLRRKASLRVWTHVLAPARLAPRSDRTRVAETMRGRPLPKAAFLYLLEQLRGWIGGLTCDVTTAWQRYETDCSYSQASSDQKERFVEQAVARCRPARLLDLGCNQGAYSFLALGAGAERVIGLDSDFGVVERAYAEGARRQVAFTPLCVSLTDPSPAQGWNLAERTGLFDRLAGDMCLALALVHHLAVAENVPLPALVRWLVGVAPRGVVEFVGKEDPMVREMLAVRSDIFPDYRLETFLELLGSEARVVRHEPIAQRDRHLIEYDV